MRLLLHFVVFLFVIANLDAERFADHVFIISFDGGKPAVIGSSPDSIMAPTPI